MITDDEAKTFAETIEYARRNLIDAISVARRAGLQVTVDVDDRAVGRTNGREMRRTEITVAVSKPVELRGSN